MEIINQYLPDHEFRQPVEEIPHPVGTGTKKINRLIPVDQPVEEFAQPVEEMAQTGVYFLNQLLPVEVFSQPVEKFLIRYSLF